MKSILFITLSILSILSISGQVNKNPVLKNDTFVTDISYSTNKSFNVLSNDRDPEGDPVKVTSFNIGSSTKVYAVNQLYLIDNWCIFAISSDGFITFAPLYFTWGYKLQFSYTVRDDKHTKGIKQKYNSIESVYICDCRDTFSRCLHTEQHPAPDRINTP